MFSKQPKGATVYSDNKKSNFFGVLWLLFGAIAILTAVVFVYKLGLFDLQSNGHEIRTENLGEPTIEIKDQANKEGYEFYNILPQQDAPSLPDNNQMEEEIEEEKIQAEYEEEVMSFMPDVVVKDRSEEKGGETEEPTQNTNQSGENTSNPNNNADNTTKSKTNEFGDVKQSNNAIASDVTTNNNVTTNNITTNTVTTEQEINYTTDGTITNSTTTDATQNKPQPIARIERVTTEQQANTDKNYVLQINTYGNADEADKRRAQVLMAGVDARVVKSTTDRNMKIYQVLSNSMYSTDEVIRAQQKLQRNGIDSLIIERRRD